MCKDERVFDEGIGLKDNSMLRHRKELFYEWDFEKNDELGLDVYKVTYGSEKVAWWICPKCKSDYDMMVRLRSGKPKSNCPYCAGQRANETNSLATLYSEIAKEWHPTLNGKLTPHDVPYGSKQEIWWLGGECGHPWDATVQSRTREKGTGCPYCSGKILVGFNDMWTTNPELSELLLNPEDGYKYTQGSSQRVDWKCSECKNIIRDRQISQINQNHLSCPKCSDGIRFPEKFMYSLLKEAGIEFEREWIPKWSQGKRYDFYLPEYNWIIETHGEQHSVKSFQSMSGNARTLEEEQENDRLKEKFAKENGVDNYIVIDCRHSTVEWIKNSILNSDIMSIVEDIDFVKIGQLSSKSLIRAACDIWNSGIQSAPRIAKIMRLHRSTAREYLIRGAEIGWCDYSAEDVQKNSGFELGKSSAKKVIQLDKDLNFIREWISGTEAGRCLNISRSHIPCVCSGKRKTAGGFNWMHKEDYDAYIASQSSI